MKQKIGAVVAALALTVMPLRADSSAGEVSITQETEKRSEDLIYSVTRTPERIFETARDVEVITDEEIRRSNAQNLGQLLERQVGIGVLNGESGSMPIVRGLGGKQVMFLIDGVKVNNATWRGPAKEYLKIFDLTQIERIEIVRGVVSVLGTESLGGVVNIITKKGSVQEDGRNISGTVGGRWASAENSYGTNVAVSGGVGNLRFHGGIAYSEADDTEAGGGVGLQASTGYGQRSGHLNAQWLLSREKTVSVEVQNLRAEDVETPGNNLVLLYGKFAPSQLQLFSASYLDLTSRRWQDSLKLTVYRNQQKDLREVVLRAGASQRVQRESDENQLNGVNLELGTFLGSHHLVYGVDFTDESIDSAKVNTLNGVTTRSRGNFADGASYRSTGVYIQDKADLGRWLTVVAGARASRFQMSVTDTNANGESTFDNGHTNVTGALSLIGHVTPTLNVIGNVVRGYRAPNLDDLTFAGAKPGFFTLANPTLDPEKVLSVEGGVKYDGARVRGSVFYFNNQFRNYIVPAPATLNGLPFQDGNGNGKRDPNESLIVQNQNVGEAAIHGFEGQLSVDLPANFGLHGHYSRLIGEDELKHTPLTLMPPAMGAVTLRYTPTSFAMRPWGEVAYRLVGAQTRLSATDIANVYIGPDGSESYRVLDLRGGFTLYDRIALTAALENVTDEKYQFIASNRYQPGRQVVIGTQFNF